MQAKLAIKSVAGCMRAAIPIFESEVLKKVIYIKGSEPVFERISLEKLISFLRNYEKILSSHGIYLTIAFSPSEDDVIIERSE